MSDGKKPKAERRPHAETPRGFRDYFGAEVTARRDMLAAITAVYHRYGFDPLETSAVETVEALGKFLPDVDRPNEGVFGWQEKIKMIKQSSKKLIDCYFLIIYKMAFRSQ